MGVPPPSIQAHEKVQFSSGKYETRSSNYLADENAKRCVLFERSYSYFALQPFEARLPGLASKLEGLDSSNWFYSEHEEDIRASFQLITRRVSDDFFFFFFF